MSATEFIAWGQYFAALAEAQSGERNDEGKPNMMESGDAVLSGFGIA